MEKGKLLSFDFFASFHNKDAFYEKIMNENNVGREIANHLVLLLFFSILYGIVMGSYNGFAQAISSGLKIPLLFILIIIICFPAFFIIQTILGSKLSYKQMISIILAGFVITTSIMLSFATIVIFFMITGDNYAFMKLLHVAIIALSGFFGMRAIVEALKFSCEKKNIYPKTGVQVFKFWIFILAFVGAQLSWSLRPFIGAKSLEFELFRQQEGNFYYEVIRSMGTMLTGKKPVDTSKTLQRQGSIQSETTDQNRENVSN